MVNFLFACMISTIVLFSLHGSRALAADAYLEFLEQEAKGLQLDPVGQTNNEEKRLIRNNLSKRRGEGTQVNLPAGLTRDGLETLLATNFHNTYLFYKVLKNRDKETVYTNYVSHAKPNLGSLSREIKLRLRR